LTVPQNIDPAFGNWLAGFIDGEGCFKIVKGKPRPGSFQWRWCLEFTLALRDDDAAILHEIHQRVGIGHLHLERPRRGSRQLRWRICSAADRAVLINLLERYPLRAKKRKSYAAWKAAHDELVLVGGPRGWNNPMPTHVLEECWSPLRVANGYPGR
jgi:hypothetical protein